MGSGSLARDLTRVPALGAWSLGHWTSREVSCLPLIFLLNFNSGGQDSLQLWKFSNLLFEARKGIFNDSLSIPSWLPRWQNGKESTCQCRRCKRHRFDPWVGKIPWRRKWQPTPDSFLEKSHGQRSLASYSPWGHKESDMTEQLNTHTHTHTHPKYFDIFDKWV